MKEVIVILFILDKKLEVKDTLSINGDIGFTTPYFDDEFKQYLDTGAETFKFSTMANTQESQHLIVGNYIAFAYEGQHKLFQMIEIQEEHSEDFMKTVYCEMAGIELINNLVRPMTINGASIKKFVDTILADTEWQLGLLDIGVNTVHDIKITDYTNVYSALQQHAVQEYGAEISLTVKLVNGKVVAKYVNIYRERGKKNGFRFSYSSNISSITKTVDSSNLATALVGVGKNNITFKEVDTPDKPLNQDFIADEESYKRWNQNGYHIMGLFKCESESPQELLKLTRKELEKRRNPKIKYELKTELLGRDEVNIGDTVYVIDHEFNPPIYLEARVSEMTVSFTDTFKNECVLSNFKEVGTKITDEMRGLINSKFPIGSNDIQDGAVGQNQVSVQYHTQLIADAVHASLIETEDLVATKADIEDLNAIKASIGKLEVGQVIAEDITAIKGNISNLESDKASIKDLEVIKGNITHLESEKINTSEFEAEIAKIDTTITNNLYVTNAEIQKLKTKDGEIENLVSQNATIINGKITNLESDVATINTAIIGKADVDDLTVTNATVNTLKVKVAEVDKAVIDNATITNAEIESLKAKDIAVEKLVASKVDVKDLNATNANVTNIDAKVATINQAVVDNASIANAEIEKLKAKNAEIDSALINKANVDDLTAINASIASLKVKDAEIDSAIIKKADVSQLTAITANISELKTDVAEIDVLKAKDVEIDNLLAGNLTAKNFKAGAITAGSAIIANGAIGSAQISDLTANKITSGEIDTGKVKVKSTNGEVELSGYQILINDTSSMTNKVNRVILGKYNKEDGTTDYGLLIRSKDGKTVMMDANGVHNAGITDGAIDNNKISDSANIDGKKLDIESVVTSINGATTKIEGTSIVVDNKNLGVTISEIENTQTAQGQELTQAKADIKATSSKIDLSVSGLETTINEQGTKIEKNESAIRLQQDEINLKVNAGEVISAIRVDSSGVKIQGDKIDLEGEVRISSLNNDPNEFGGIFEQEFNQTVINGGRIQTNSIKAQKIDLNGLTVLEQQADGTEEASLQISDKGSVRLKGDIESFDYNKQTNTGWQLSKEGNATLNNATVRGSVILPSGGITDATDDEGANNVRIWAGAEYEDREKAPFKVMQNGDIHAENGTFKGTFAGKIEIGNILIEDTVDSKGRIQFESETGAKVVDIGEDEVKFGVNTTIGTDSSNVAITKTDTTFTNQDINVVKTVNGKTNTVIQVDINSNEFMHLNGTHKLITDGSTLVIDGNQTEFTNNVIVRNSISTNDMIVGNMQMKKRIDAGNKGIDFIFV